MSECLGVCLYAGMVVARLVTPLNSNPLQMRLSSSELRAFEFITNDNVQCEIIDQVLRVTPVLLTSPPSSVL